MRRKEKQIDDPAVMEAIINRSSVCRVALCAGNQPYIVPLCFGYEGGAIYVHGASEGKKIDIIRHNPNVCVAFDADIDIVPAEDACRWSVKYRSVIAFGSATVIEDPDRKREALNIIMRQYAGRGSRFPDKAVAATTVIRIDIVSMTGKQSG